MKKLCFVLIRGILPAVFLEYGVLLTGMRLKRYFGLKFWKFYKRDKFICTNDEAEGNHGLILGRFSLLTYL